MRNNNEVKRKEGAYSEHPFSFEFSKNTTVLCTIGYSFRSTETISTCVNGSGYYNEIPFNEKEL